MTITRHGVGARLSQAVAYGDTVYLAGQVADDIKADVQTQAQQILAKIDKLLAETGSDKTKLLSATVWLTDMANFAAFNKIWDPWVSAGNTPARACVQAQLAQPGYLVEIAIIAARSA